MSKEFRGVQVGVGKMAKFLVPMGLSKGVTYVGAIDTNPDLVGKDLGEVLGIEPLGVTITHADDAEKMLAEVNAHICYITTASLMVDLDPVFTACVKHANCISTCEESFYPFDSAPKISASLDALAKEYGHTITGCGYQDVFWYGQIINTAGAVANIKAIRGVSSYNVEDYGIELAKVHGAGFTLDEFNEQIKKVAALGSDEIKAQIEAGTFLPSYMFNVVGCLADRLGLTIVGYEQSAEPIIAEVDTYSSTLGRTIPAGDCLGMSAIAKAFTKEGIELEAGCIGKVYAEGEVSINDWTIENDYTSINVSSTNPIVDELTCGSMINRSVDVVNAEPGYVPVSRLPLLENKVGNLGDYLN